VSFSFCNLDVMVIFTPITSVDYLKQACLLIFLMFFFGAASAKEHHFLVLNYHDIVGEEGAKPPFNSMDVSVDHF